MTVKDDFEMGPIADLGVEVTRTAVVMTTDSDGQKVYTDGASEEITVVFMPTNPKFALDKSGNAEVCDAKIFTKIDQTINKYDKISFQERTYIVDKVNKRKFQGVFGFNSVLLFLTEK